MAEHIEREALKKRMNATCRNCDARFDERECGRCGMEWAREIVKTAPAADVAPVVHGRWKCYRKQNIAVCTNCSFERDLDANFGKAVSCPNCGARMDGEWSEV